MGRYVLKILLVVTAAAWTALVVEGFVDVLSFKGFAVLCVVAALAPSLAMIRAHSLETQRTAIEETRAHAERMERAVERHADLVARQETLAERVSDCLTRGMARARIEVAEQNGSAADTGPFPIYNRRI